MAWNVLLAHQEGPEQRRIEATLRALGGAVTLVTAEPQLGYQFRDTYHDLVILDGQVLSMSLLRFLPVAREGMRMNATAPTIALIPSPRETPRADYARAGYYASFETPIEHWRLREMIYTIGLAERPMFDRYRSLALIAALSDKTTLATLEALQSIGPATSTEVAVRLNWRSRQRASSHIESLIAAGLVTSHMLRRPGPNETGFAPIESYRTTIETVADMQAARWDVVSRCESCSFSVSVDLDQLSWSEGAAAVLWGRRQPCPCAGCRGAVQFFGRPPAGGGYQALVAS